MQVPAYLAQGALSIPVLRDLGHLRGGLVSVNVFCCHQRDARLPWGCGAFQPVASMRLCQLSSSAV